MVLHGGPSTACLNINNLSIESEEIIKVPYSLSVRNLGGAEVVFIPGIYCSDERTLGRDYGGVSRRNIDSRSSNEDNWTNKRL